MSLLLFSALFTFVLLLLGRRGVGERSGRRLRSELDALFSGEHEYREVTPAEFPYADVDYYDRVQKEMEGLGFRKLSDVEDLTLSRVYPDARTFVRVMVDDGAMIRAGAFHLRSRGGLVTLFSALGVIPRHVHVLELVTEVPRGRFLVTAPTRGLDRLDPPPEAQVDRLPPGTPATELVAHHRRRIQEYLRAHPAHSPVQVDSTEAVLASVQRSHLAASRHRQGLGRLSRDELERMTGGPIGEEEAELLHEVQRRPKEE